LTPAIEAHAKTMLALHRTYVYIESKLHNF